MASKTLEIIVTATDKGATKAFKNIDDAAGTTGGKLSKLGSDIGPGLTTAAAAVVAGVGFAMKSAFDAAEESAKIGRETERVLQTTGASAWTTADQIGDLAGSMSELTGADDELIQSGANLLLTFTNIKNQVGENNDIFDQATGLALDMSTALGTDMSGASIQLGKALNDPVKGITALSRAGVSFTEQQKDQIKTLSESGDILGAQKIILAELSKEFGGAAEAAKTPMDVLRVKLGNFQEDLGATLVPIISGAADKLGFMIGMFEALPGPVQIGVVALSGIATTIGAGVVLFDKLTDTFGPVMGKIMPVVGGLIDDVGLKIGMMAEKAGMSAGAATTMAGAFGGVLAGALAAAAIAMVAFSLYQKSQAEDAAEATAGQEKFAAALAKTTGAREDNAIQAAADVFAEKRIAGAVLEHKGNLEVLGASIVKNDQSFEGYRGTINRLTQDLTPMMEMLRENAAAGDKAATEILRLYDANLLSDNATKDLVLTLDDIQDQYETAGSTTAAYAEIQRGMAGATINTTTATENQITALDDLINKNLEITSPYFAHLKAQEAVTKAQNDYNEAVKQYGANSPQAVDAAGKQLEAGLKLEEAILKLNKAQTDGGTSQDAMTKKIQELVDKGLVPGSTELDTYKEKLLEMGYTVDIVNGKPVVVKVDYAAIAEALRLAQAFNTAMGYTIGFDGKLYNSSGNRVTGNSTTPFANGGMVGDGLFTVGEEGPELGFKSGNNVRIFSNPDSARMIGSTSSRSTNVYNTINMPAGANGDDVVRALKQYERANGALYASV